jgi:hypothetical protein
VGAADKGGGVGRLTMPHLLPASALVLVLPAVAPPPAGWLAGVTSRVSHRCDRGGNQQDWSDMVVCGHAGKLAAWCLRVCVWFVCVWFEEPVSRPRVRQVCLSLLLVCHAVFSRVAPLLWCSCACWLDKKTPSTVGRCTSPRPLPRTAKSGHASTCGTARQRLSTGACAGAARWMPASTVLRQGSAVLYAALWRSVALLYAAWPPEVCGAGRGGVHALSPPLQHEHVVLVAGHARPHTCENRL